MGRRLWEDEDWERNLQEAGWDLASDWMRNVKDKESVAGLAGFAGVTGQSEGEQVGREKTTDLVLDA